MKRLLLFLLLSVGAFAASPTVVQSSPATCLSVGTTTISCSFPVNVTAGNMIVVWVLNDSATINTPTMTGETFVNSAGCSNTASAANAVKCFTVNSATGGNKTVTATGGSGDIHVHMAEINGQTASPIDCTNAAAESSTASISCTTTNANDLVLAFFGDEHTAKTLTVGSGYTKIQLTSGGGGDSAISEWKSVSATGSQTATAGGNSTDAVVRSIIAIKGTAGGATVHTLTTMGAGPS